MSLALLIYMNGARASDLTYAFCASPPWAPLSRIHRCGTSQQAMGHGKEPAARLVGLKPDLL